MDPGERLIPGKLNLPKLPFLLALLLAACAPATQTPKPAWRLIWADEFNLPPGSPVDRSKWNVDTGSGGKGNGELQYYTDSTLNAVHDGQNLVITALEQRSPDLRC